MRKVFFLLLAFTFSLANVNGQTVRTANLEIKRLSPLVYAAFGLAGGNAACNAGVIDMGDGVLVFDPFLTPAAATELKDFISGTLKKPVKWVVNSHPHNDHIRGNQVFDQATIIGTVLGREIIKTKEPQDIAAEKNFVPGRVKYYNTQPLSPNKWQADEDAIWKGYFAGIADSHASLKTILPNLAFTDSLILFGSGTQVKLLSYGDGHSASDLFMYLPNEKIIFTGDLLFIDYHPYVAESKMENWANYLRKMRMLYVERFIPGHGPLGTKENIEWQLEYFNQLQASTKKLKKIPGVTAKQIEEQMPEEYNPLHLRNFYLFNIQSLLKK